MKVIYEKTTLEQIYDAVRDARAQCKLIKTIMLNRDELAMLHKIQSTGQSSARELKGMPRMSLREFEEVTAAGAYTISGVKIGLDYELNEGF